jgi:hypothetical protein
MSSPQYSRIPGRSPQGEALYGPVFERVRVGLSKRFALQSEWYAETKPYWAMHKIWLEGLPTWWEIGADFAPDGKVQRRLYAYARLHLRPEGAKELKTLLAEWQGPTDVREITHDRARVTRWSPYQAIDCYRRPDDVAEWVVDQLVILLATASVLRVSTTETGSAE